MAQPDKPKATWNPWTSFDATAEEIELAKKRQALIAQKKAEFRRITADPRNILANGQGGHIVDPAIQRWYSSRGVFANYFKINRKSVGLLLGTFIGPIAFLYYVTMREIRDSNARSKAGLMSSKEKSMKAYLF